MKTTGFYIYTERHKVVGFVLDRGGLTFMFFKYRLGYQWGY